MSSDRDNLARVSSAGSDLVRQALEEEYDAVRRQFPGQEIHLEGGEIAYVRVFSGDWDHRAWELRYFPPSAVEFHHSADGLCGEMSLHDDLAVPIENLPNVTMEDLAALLEGWVRLRALGGRTPQHPPTGP